jgi:hypothetical protein
VIHRVRFLTASATLNLPISCGLASMRRLHCRLSFAAAPRSEATPRRLRDIFFYVFIFNHRME